MFDYLRQNEKGQTMTFVVLGMMVLVMFWMMVVNVGILEYRRIKMQNAVDAAALTASRIQANGLNQIGVLNFWVWATLMPQRYCDWLSIPNKYFMICDKSKMGQLQTLTSAQSNLNRGYSGLPMIYARRVARANGADSLYPLSGFSLKLRHQKGDILWMRKWCIWLPKIGRVCFCLPYRYKREKLWMYRQWGGSEPQPPHRVRFVATKSGGKVPIGGNLLGINMPTIRTTAQGRTWLNTKAHTIIPLYKGGFPEEKVGVFFPLYQRRAFDAGLTPVPGFQH